QDMQGILRKTILDQPYPEPTDDDYITLGAVKSEFVSSIYSGSINGNLTANQFIKSGGTDHQVLLANGTTKAISKFGSGEGDMSNQVQKTGQSLQVIKGYIRKSMQDVDDEPSEEDEDYITNGEVAIHYVSIYGDIQQIIGTKHFYEAVTANWFKIPSGTNQQVLLANEDVKPLSEFASGSVDDSNFVKKTGQITQSIEGQLIRSGSMESFNGANMSEYLTKDQIVGGCVLTNGGGNVNGNIEESGSITSASFVKFLKYLIILHRLFLSQFESSTELENSEISFVPPAPSNIKVSSAPELINDAPVIDAIPSIVLVNLQALQNVLFAFIVYAVPKETQSFSSVLSAFNNNRASSSVLFL
ncbi:MAG: hypothetical protein EZS28_034660, partial [Streblomastix strix]